MGTVHAVGVLRRAPRYLAEEPIAQQIVAEPPWMSKKLLLDNGWRQILKFCVDFIRASFLRQKYKTYISRRKYFWGDVTASLDINDLHA